MFSLNIDPVLFDFGVLQIRWYGIIYALSFLIGYWYVQRAVKERNLKLDVDSLFTCLILGTVIGARVFEVLFYNWSYYSAHLLQVLYVWQGGLSFHGGLVGSIFGCLLFCRKYKVKFLLLADLLVIPLAFGLFLGRIANFINGELFGFPTTLPWGVDFGDGVARHPTQLYESLKNLLIFFVLLVLKKRFRQQYFSGYLFMMFFLLYGSMRFVLEFLKVPEASWFGFTVGQWFSLVMACIGVVGIFYLHRHEKKVDE